MTRQYVNRSSQSHNKDADNWILQRSALRSCQRHGAARSQPAKTLTSLKEFPLSDRSGNTLDLMQIPVSHHSAKLIQAKLTIDQASKKYEPNRFMVEQQVNKPDLAITSVSNSQTVQRAGGEKRQAESSEGGSSNSKKAKVDEEKVKYGGKVYETPPQGSVRIACHYTGEAQSEKIKSEGIQISQATTGKGGAVQGINQDGEGFYTTKAEDFPYYMPDKGQHKYGVYIAQSIKDNLKTVKATKISEGGFQSAWWQDDPKLKQYITEYDIIERESGDKELKFNPRSVQWIALVYEKYKPATKAPTDLSGISVGGEIPEDLKSYLRSNFKNTDSFEEQQNSVRDYIRKKYDPNKVLPGKVFKWMREEGIAAPKSS